MKKRKNIPPKVLASESGAITQFLFDRALPTKGAKVPIALFFDAYKNWRLKNKLPPSSVNIDGFGRLFPHAYLRKSAYWKPLGHSCKCVFGVTLV